MRWLLLLAFACGSSSKQPAPPVPVSTEVTSCAEAAAGIENGTRSIREPGTSVVSQLRVQCIDEAWPVEAITCFATMTEDDLGRCAGALPPPARSHLFAQLGGAGDDRAAIAIAQARLHGLAVGVVECDNFVTAVARALGCDAMPLAQRVQLANETADFWSLPTTNLPANAAKRMADVCGKSLTFLREQVADAGCMP